MSLPVVMCSCSHDWAVRQAVQNIASKRHCHGSIPSPCRKIPNLELQSVTATKTAVPPLLARNRLMNVSLAPVHCWMSVNCTAFVASSKRYHMELSFVQCSVQGSTNSAMVLVKIKVQLKSPSTACISTTALHTVQQLYEVRRSRMSYT